MGNKHGGEKSKEKEKRKEEKRREKEAKKKKKNVKKKAAPAHGSELDTDFESSHVTGADSESGVFHSAENLAASPYLDSSTRSVLEQGATCSGYFDSAGYPTKILSSKDFKDGFSLEAVLPPDIAKRHGSESDDVTKRSDSESSIKRHQRSASTAKSDDAASVGKDSVQSGGYSTPLLTTPVFGRVNAPNGSASQQTPLATATLPRVIESDGSAPPTPKLDAFRKIPEPTSPHPQRRILSPKLASATKIISSDESSSNPPTPVPQRKQYATNGEPLARTGALPIPKLSERARADGQVAQEGVKVSNTYHPVKNIQADDSDKAFASPMHKKFLLANGSNVNKHQLSEATLSDVYKSPVTKEYDRQKFAAQATLSNVPGQYDGGSNNSKEPPKKSAAFCIMKLEELERSIEKTIKEKFPDAEPFILRRQAIDEDVKCSQSLPTTPSLKKKLRVVNDSHLQSELAARLDNVQRAERTYDESDASPPSPAMSPVVLRRFGARTRHASISPKIQRAKTAALYNSPSDIPECLEAPSATKTVTKVPFYHAVATDQPSRSQAHTLDSTTVSKQGENKSDLAKISERLRETLTGRSAVKKGNGRIKEEKEEDPVIVSTDSAVFGSISPKLKRRMIPSRDTDQREHNSANNGFQPAAGSTADHRQHQLPQSITTYPKQAVSDSRKGPPDAGQIQCVKSTPMHKPQKQQTAERNWFENKQTDTSSSVGVQTKLHSSATETPEVSSECSHFSAPSSPSVKARVRSLNKSLSHDSAAPQSSTKPCTGAKGVESLSPEVRGERSLTCGRSGSFSPEMARHSPSGKNKEAGESRQEQIGSRKNSADHVVFGSPVALPCRAFHRTRSQEEQSNKPSVAHAQTASEKNAKKPSPEPEIRPANVITTSPAAAATAAAAESTAATPSSSSVVGSGEYSRGDENRGRPETVNTSVECSVIEENKPGDRGESVVSEPNADERREAARGRGGEAAVVTTGLILQPTFRDLPECITISRPTGKQRAPPMSSKEVKHVEHTATVSTHDCRPQGDQGADTATSMSLPSSPTVFVKPILPPRDPIFEEKSHSSSKDTPHDAISKVVVGNEPCISPPSSKAAVKTHEPISPADAVDLIDFTSEKSTDAGMQTTHIESSESSAQTEGSEPITKGKSKSIPGEESLSNGKTGEASKEELFRESQCKAVEDFEMDVSEGEGGKTEDSREVVPPPSPTALDLLIEEMDEEDDEEDDDLERRDREMKQKEIEAFGETILKRLSSLLETQSDDEEYKTESDGSEEEDRQTTKIIRAETYEQSGYQASGASASERRKNVDDLITQLEQSFSEASDGEHQIQSFKVSAYAMSSEKDSSDSDSSDTTESYESPALPANLDIEGPTFLHRSPDPEKYIFQPYDNVRDFDDDDDDDDAEQNNDVIARAYHSDDDVTRSKDIPDYYDDRPLWARRRKPPTQASLNLAEMRRRQRREKWIRKRRRNKSDLSTGSSENTSEYSSHQGSMTLQDIFDNEDNEITALTIRYNKDILGSGMLQSPKYMKPILPFLGDIQKRKWEDVDVMEASVASNTFAEGPSLFLDNRNDNTSPSNRARHRADFSDSGDDRSNNNFRSLYRDDEDVYNDRVGQEDRAGNDSQLSIPGIEETFSELMSVKNILDGIQDKSSSSMSAVTVREESNVTDVEAAALDTAAAAAAVDAGVLIPVNLGDLKAGGALNRRDSLGRRSRLSESDIDISEPRDDLSTDSIIADDEDEGLEQTLSDDGAVGQDTVISRTFYNSSTHNNNNNNNDDDDNDRRDDGNDSDDFWGDGERSYRQLEAAADAVSSTFQNARDQMHDIQHHLQALRRQMETLQDDLTSTSFTITPDLSLESP